MADRGNSQVQRYDLERGFKRSFETGFITTPSERFRRPRRSIDSGRRARVTVLDGDDSLVCYMGENGAICDVAGWPNNKNNKGETVRIELLSSGKFNSPHGMAVDGDGNIYIAEWVIEGRHIRLPRF